MNDKSLKTLEYKKIIDKLCGHASSELGKALCSKLTPINDIEKITYLQTQTAHALSRIWKNGGLSFQGIRNITPSLKRLQIGSSLGIVELLDISSLLTVTSRAKSYGRRDESDESRDSLDEMFNILEPLTNLNNEIKRCIISVDEISDDASSALKDIRRKIKYTNDQIHVQLNKVLNSSSTKSYLQDFVITMRNGRYCIPVKTEQKNNVPGMIHDQSASGSTVFIEPMAVVKLNNELKELAGREQEEIDRILALLSELTAENIEILESNLSILVDLDFIFAKASFAKSLKASEPVFNTDGIINIKQGRHPLIDQKSVVPIDIRIGDDFSMLIVTGPNTGGKTVAIKTVGLLTLMGQSGLHIPAFEGSKLAVFDNVFADIGDEQSIEQSLSTFSSHMTNIVKILEEADENSLVLFDELCSGTDPTEGAALAISILTFLHNMRVRAMATTHYSELKVFALQTKDVENACCEFNVETLRPTYRLLIGVPGKSNAFAISGKLGLPDYIIEEAKTNLNTDDIAFEDLLTDLENSRAAIENDRTEIARYKSEVADLKKKLEIKHDNINDRRENILREANEEARKILQEAKDFADKTVKNVNKYGKDANNKALENERRQVGEKIKNTNSKLGLKGQPRKKSGHKPGDFKLGDAVRVLTMGLDGTVSSLPNAKGDMFVQMGILRSQVNYKDLEIKDEQVITGPNIKKTSSGKIRMTKSASISSEINLLGMTVDEAISRLDKYLDDASMSHLTTVRIVHGKGTGALRNAVHSHLKKQKNIKSYRLGVFGEGDAGVTIVEFK